MCHCMHLHGQLLLPVGAHAPKLSLLAWNENSMNGRRAHTLKVEREHHVSCWDNACAYAYFCVRKMYSVL